MSRLRTIRLDWVLGILGVALLGVGVLIATRGEATRSAPGTAVIALTQVPCQFLEAENDTDRGFRSRQATDCEAINARTSTRRLAEAKPLVLAPGRYVFRVTNKNVPYDLGFWLRGDGLVNRAKLPSVSGGGIATGKTQEYTVDLKPGTYVYSCPLNPTPDYRLVVTDG